MSSPSDRTPPSPTLPAPPPDPMPDNTGDYVGDTNAMMPNPMPTREAVQHEELPAPGAERPGATNPAALPMQKGPAIDLDDDPLAPAHQRHNSNMANNRKSEAQRRAVVQMRVVNKTVVQRRAVVPVVEFPSISPFHHHHNGEEHVERDQRQQDVHRPLIQSKHNQHRRQPKQRQRRLQTQAWPRHNSNNDNNNPIQRNRDSNMLHQNW